MEPVKSGVLYYIVICKAKLIEFPSMCRNITRSSYIEILIAKIIDERRITIRPSEYDYIRGLKHKAPAIVLL